MALNNGLPFTETNASVLQDFLKDFDQPDRYFSYKGTDLSTIQREMLTDTGQSTDSGHLASTESSIQQSNNNEPIAEAGDTDQALGTSPENLDEPSSDVKSSTSDGPGDTLDPESNKQKPTRCLAME